MNRRAFLTNTCKACLGLAVLASMGQSCANLKILTVDLEGNELVVPLEKFEFSTKKGIAYKKNVVVYHGKMEFPICVFRKNANDYSAIYMRCSHQGAELQVFGDKLQCPAHGSEFNAQGQALSAPAFKNLQSFPIRIEENNLKILVKS